MTQKIKLSWTILQSWSKGDKDLALMMLHGQQPTLPATPEMKFGSKIHDEIAKNKLLLIPELSTKTIFECYDNDGNFTSDRHKYANYKKVEILGFADYSMIMDAYDPVNKIIVDWKTGMKLSTAHNKLQPYIYAYIMTLLGNEINWVALAHVDKTDKGIVCLDYTLYKMTPEKLDVAENYIATVGSEIYNEVFNSDNE